MSVTRRTFLRSGTVAVLTTAAALHVSPLAFGQIGAKPDPAQDFHLPYEAKQSPLFYLKRESFQPYVGGSFLVRAGAQAVEMRLLNVRDCTPSAQSRRVTKRWRESECFAVVFTAEEKLTDLTSIYDVEHDGLGKFALFLTRRDGPRGTYFYEAVFNHAR